MLKEHLKKHFKKIQTIKLKRHHYILGGFGIAAIIAIASIFGFQKIGTFAENTPPAVDCEIAVNKTIIKVGEKGTATITCTQNTGTTNLLKSNIEKKDLSYNTGVLSITIPPNQQEESGEGEENPKGGTFSKTYRINYTGIGSGKSSISINPNIMHNSQAFSSIITVEERTGSRCKFSIYNNKILTGQTSTGTITCNNIIGTLRISHLSYSGGIIGISNRSTEGNKYTFNFSGKNLGSTSIEITGTNATILGIENTESAEIDVINKTTCTVVNTPTEINKGGTGKVTISCSGDDILPQLTKNNIDYESNKISISLPSEHIVEEESTQGTDSLEEQGRGISTQDGNNFQQENGITTYEFTYTGKESGTSQIGLKANTMGYNDYTSGTDIKISDITCSIDVSKEDIAIDGTGTVTITCKGLDESPYVNGTRDITYTPTYIDLSFLGCRRDDKDYKCSYNYTGKIAGTSEITLKSNSVFGNAEAISYEGGIKVHEKTTCNVHVSNTGIKEGGTGIATITCNGTIYASTLYEEDIEMNTHIINAGVEPHPTGHSQETNIIIERGAQHLYIIPYTGRAVGESTFNLRANVMGNNEGATGDTIYVRANTTEYITQCEWQTETEQVEVGKTGNITLTCNQENLPEVNLRDIITIRSINLLVQPEINQIIEVGQTQIDIRNNEAETTTYILSFTGTQTGNIQLTISGTIQYDKDTTYTFLNGKNTGNIEIYEKGGMGSAPKCTIEGETPVALNNNGTITVSCSGDNLGFYSEDSMKAINALTYGRKIEVKNAPEIRDSNDNITLIYGFTGTEEGTTILKLNNNVITNGGIPNVEVQGNDIEITNNITSCTWGDGDTSILKDHTGSMNLSCPQSIKIDALKPMISPLNTNILTVTDVTQEGNEGGNRIYKVTYEGNNTGTTKLTINGTYNGQTYTQTRPSDDITVIDDTPFNCKININPTQNTVGGNGTIQITCEGQEYAEQAQKNWLEYNEEIIDVSTWGTQNGNEVTFIYTGRNPGLSHVKLKTGVISNNYGATNNPATGDDIKIYYTGICTRGTPNPATITTGERGTITLECPKNITGFADSISIRQTNTNRLETKVTGNGPSYIVNYTGKNLGSTKLILNTNPTPYIHLSDGENNSDTITVIGKDKPKCTIDISHTVIPRNRTGSITVTCSGTNRSNLTITGIDYSSSIITLSPILSGISNDNTIYTMTYTGRALGYTQFGIKTGAISAGTVSNDYIAGDDIIVIGTGRIVCGWTTPNPQDIETEGTGKISITGCNFGGLSYSELVDRIDPYIISLVETKNEIGKVSFSTGRRLTDNIIYRGIETGSTHFIINGEINEYVSVYAAESEQINVYGKIFKGCAWSEPISPIGIGVAGYIDLRCDGIDASSEVSDGLRSIIQFSQNGKINTGNVENQNGSIRFHYSGKANGQTTLTASGQSEGLLYYSETPSDPIVVTNAKPTCSISLNPTSRTSGTVTLTLTSSNATKYSRTGFENMVTSIGTKTVSTNGTYTGYVQNAAGNTGLCTGKVSIIDKTKPTVSFNKESGNAASSHTVKVTANDANAGLKSSQKIKYRWQTEETCSTIASQYSTGATLSPTTAGTKTASGNVTTPSNLTDGAYYLCIMEGSISDRAGNTNDIKRSTGTFIIDRTAPSLPTCTANACFSGGINVSCTIAGEGNTIHYTTDYSTPTCSSPTWNSNQTFTGDTTLKVTACDSSNNYSGYNQYTYTVDNYSPDDSIINTEPEFTQGLNNTIESTPAQEVGCNNTTYYQYCISTTNSTSNCTNTNISEWSENTGTTFNNLTDGQKYYYFVRTKDGLGNTNEWTGSTYSTQDNTAPVIELSGSGVPSIIKSGTAVTIYIKVTDTVSGISTGDFTIGDLSFKVGGSTVTPGTRTLTWQSTNNGVSIYKLVLNKVSGNGALTITIANNAITDNVGNSSVGSTLDPNVTVDNIAPTISFTDNVTGNYVTGDTITVSWGSDAIVKKYKFDRTCSEIESSYNDTTATDFTQITEENNGKYLCLLAKDEAGNKKVLRSVNTIHIDKTAPEGGSFSINDGAEYTNSNDVILNIICANDVGIGNVKVAYGNSANPTNWTSCTGGEELKINHSLESGDGEKTVYVRFKDGLENSTEDTTNTITINNDKPNISANNSSTSSRKKANITIKLMASSNVGLNYAKYSWTGFDDCINNGSGYNSGDTISYSTEGVKTLYLCAEDVSNITATWSGKYMLDKTRPTVTFDVQSGAAANRHEIVVTANDPEYSKLVANPKIRYKRETGDICSVTASEYTELTINATGGKTNVSGSISTNGLDDGSYYLCILAGKTKDGAGNTNEATKTTGRFTVDNTAPISGDFKINNNATYTTGTNVTLNTICPTDAGEGTVEVAYGTGEEPTNWTTCSENIEFTLPSGNGTKTVYMRFKDGLGNTTEDVSDTIILDSTAPTITFSANSGSAQKSHSVTVTVKDTLSKLEANQSLKYKWENGFACSNTESEYTEISLGNNGGITSTTKTISTPNNLPDGEYLLCILGGTVSDQAGNKNAKAQTLGRFTIDNTPPEAPTCTTNKDSCFNGVITVTCTGEEGTILHYTTDGTKPSCEDTNLREASSSRGGVGVVGSSKPHTFTKTTNLQIIACDAAGNSSGSNYTYELDETEPKLPELIEENIYTKGLSNTIYSFEVNDQGCNGSVEYQFCIIDQADVELCNRTENQSTRNREPEAEFSNLTDGKTYYYYVRAKDGLGNTSIWSKERQSSTQDASAPVIRIKSKNGTFVNNSTSLEIEIEDGISGIDPSGFEIGDLQILVGGEDITSTTEKALTYKGESEGIYNYNLALEGLRGNGDLTIMSKTGAVTDGVGNDSELTGLDSESRVDTIKPVCTINEITKHSLSTAAGHNTGEVTIYCIDTGAGISTMNLQNSAIDYTTNVVTLSNLVTGTITSGISYTFTYTATQSGSTTFQLKTGTVSDRAGNTNDASNKSGTVDVLTDGPTITIEQPEHTEWTTHKKVTASSTGTLKMSEGTSTICDSSREFTNYEDKTYSSEDDNGTYICYKSEDTFGNITYRISEVVEKIDTTAPVLSRKTDFNNGRYNTNQTVTFIYEDTGAGISGSDSISCQIENEGLSSTCTINNPNICDLAGNCNTDSQESNPIKLDKTKATSTINTSNTERMHGSLSVSVTDSGGISNLGTCYYYVKDGTTTSDISPRACNDNVNINCTTQGENQCTIYVYAVDGAGNTGDTISRSYSNETSTLSVGDPEIYSGIHFGTYFKGTIGIRAVINNANSCEYTINGSIWTAGTIDSNYCVATITPNTDITVTFRAISIGGSVETGNSAPFTYDNTAPILSGKTTFSDGWYTGNQSSTFVYNDTGVGISGSNSISCSIEDEGLNSTCTISNPNICDRLGNCNTTSVTSNQIKLDKTAPVLSGKTEFSNGRFNTDQTSVFSYEDSISGISGANTTSCDITNGGTSATCTTTNTNICNNAGLCNTTNQTSNSIKLDKTKATSTINTPNTERMHGSLSVSVTDSGGISNLGTCYYYVKDGTTTSDISPRACNDNVNINCTTQGENQCTIYVYAVDGAGNTGDTISRSYSNETSTLSVGDPEIYSGIHFGTYFKGTIGIRAVINNANSCEYTINGSTWTAGTIDSNYCIATITPNTDITVTFRAISIGGTIETGNSATFIYDNAAPVLSGKTEFSDGWYTGNQTSTFVYNDTGVGISGNNSISCSIEDEGLTSTCTISNPNICDKLGNCNTTSVTSNSIKLDKTMENGEINVTYPSGVLTNGCTSGSVTLTLSGTDTNGLHTLPYKRNNGSWTGNATMTLTNNGHGTGYIRDAAGNIKKIPYNVTGISLSGPDIFLDSPISGTILTGLVHFEWNSTTDNPTCQAIDGGYNIEVYSGTEIVYTGNTTDTSKETTLSDGTYIWNVYATDVLGHTSISETRTLIINSQAPTCDIDYIPGSGTNTSGDVLAILTGCTEGTTGFNATGYLFTGNGTYTFTFINGLGVTGNAIANVNRIDKDGPVLAEITAIGTTTDTTPDYTFSSNETGTIAYSGACSSATTGAVSGNNTITLNQLSVGTYSGCTITVTDEVGNISNVLTISEFTIRRSGGGGGTLHKDNCPDGDYSDSYYDGTCKGSHNSDRTRDICKVDESRFSDEMKLAYIYSYAYGMTTMCPINDADLDGYLRRDHLAKMLSQYAINVLDLEPEAGKSGCTAYNDIASESAEMKYYIKTACELGLMGLKSDGDTPLESFYPHGLVSRAEFGTTLSRLIYGDKYNLDSEEENSYPGAWYGKHLAALKRDEIMTEIYGDRPSHLELRGYVMLMVMRHGKGRLNIETNNSSTRTGNTQNTSSSTRTGNTQNTSSNTNTVNNSDFLSIYNKNKEITCNFTYTSGTEYSTGIIYANSNKLKQINNEVRPEKSRDYLLVNNKKVYVRGDSFDTGYGVVFDYTGNVYDDIKEISETNQYKFTNCKNTVESNSVFNIPSNIRFITFAELLEEMFTAMFQE